MTTVEKQKQPLVGDGILSANEDEHNGVVIEMSQEPMDSSLFVSLLGASISHWRRLEGFYFHHAEPKYLMLVKWLQSTPNTLPANASHRVGIGAFLTNEKNEVLVVQEKSGRFHGKGVWKCPTGVVDEGEDICDAAVREVKEETGVDAKFVEILAFRQSHKSFFEKSDLFFVCMLEPLSFDIQPQESEIEAAQWMPYEEYAAQSFVRNNELLRYISEIYLTKKNGRYAGFTPEPTVTSFSREKCFLYFNRRDLNCQ